MSSDDSELISVRSHADEVVEIALNRHEALNALSMSMLGALENTVQVVRSRHPRAVVLTSTVPRAFCVGADLKERGTMTAQEVIDTRPALLAGYRALLWLECPTIAAIEGFCLGGGLELALTCDMLVCAQSAILGLPEVTIGIIPGGGGTQLLGRRVGWGAANELLLTGSRITATEAGRLGLVDHVVDDDARAAAMTIAHRAAQASPAAVAAAKRALRDGWGLSLSDGLSLEDREFTSIVTGPDRAEGLSAFREKRPPRWASAHHRDETSTRRPPVDPQRD